MNIYEYDDFRLYLKDRYDEKCREVPGYSYRKFAADAELTNPGFLNDVIKGRRKLSRDATEKMIAVFSLSEIEADFFRLLVSYRQSKNSEEQQQLYKKIVFRRNRSSFTRVDPKRSKYYQDFRYPLIRTALMSMPFSGDYEALGHFTVPQIPATQVKKYVRDLCDWGMVKQESDGMYIVIDKTVEPPEKMRDLVKQIHREWITQTLEPLMKLTPEKRHISSMLLSVSEATKRKITEKIETFRHEVWKIVNEDENEADSVMLLNIQYIPKSKKARR